MYVNPYERLKNFNSKENQDEKNYGQNTNIAFNNQVRDENLVIKEISKLCRDRTNDEQFFALIDRDERNIKTMRDEFIAQTSVLPIIKIDIKKLELYNESYIFLLKKIFKGLPLVSHEDKKILWDRIKLFSEILNLKGKFNETDRNTMVILNELDFDEPLEYIKKEFDEILRAYSVDENIVILIENIYGISYKKYRQIIDFLQAVFANSITFKFVAFINEIHYKRLSSEYGNEEYSSVLQLEISLFSKYYFANQSIASVNINKPTSKKLSEEEEDSPSGINLWNYKRNRAYYIQFVRRQRRDKTY